MKQKNLKITWRPVILLTIRICVIELKRPARYKIIMIWKTNLLGTASLNKDVQAVTDGKRVYTVGCLVP